MPPARAAAALTTLADRILAHLAAYPVEPDAHDVPREVTQEGIADAVGARVAHVSRALKSLLEDGLVSAHLAHPRGGTRRARAHCLTAKGREAARGLKPAPAAPRAPEPRPAPPAAGARPPAGRARQVEALLAALDRARTHGPVVALVEGDAGSGKTRLLAALVAEAQRRGAQAVLARGGPVGEPQLVGPLGVALGQWGFERRYRAREAGTPRERALAAAVETIVAAARERPVLLALDDVHHAGPAAADLLHGVAVALPAGTRVLLVASFRREEAWALPNGPLYAALEPVRALPHAAHVDLGPLDEAGVVALLEDAGVHVKGERPVPPDLVKRVWRESGGNALYALAMGQALADGVDEEDFFPPAVREDARQHFNRLPPDALAALQLAAVAGPEVAYGTLQRASGRPEAELVASLDHLLDRLVLEEVPGGDDLLLRFRHPKVREALLADLSAARRRHLEALVAEAGPGAG